MQLLLVSSQSSRDCHLIPVVNGLFASSLFRMFVVVNFWLLFGNTMFGQCVFYAGELCA